MDERKGKAVSRGDQGPKRRAEQAGKHGGGQPEIAGPVTSTFPRALGEGCQLLSSKRLRAFTHSLYSESIHQAPVCTGPCPEALVAGRSGAGEEWLPTRATGVCRGGSGGCLRNTGCDWGSETVCTGHPTAQAGAGPRDWAEPPGGEATFWVGLEGG